MYDHAPACPHHTDTDAETGPPHPGARFGEPSRATTRAEVSAEAVAWLGQLAAEHDTCPRARIAEVTAAIARTGSYAMTSEELTYAAKVAWRNNTRCVGRLFWKGLQVRDMRHLTDPDAIFESCLAHIEEAYNGGRIRPVASIFAPGRPGERGIRIWNHQLVRYAGYRRPDGSVIGDPHSVPFTERALALGWRAPGTPHDILPLVIEVPGRAPALYEVPPEAVREIPIVHPELDWFAALDLRWYPVPIISEMALDAGGLYFPCAPFSGWYVSSEIAARNFADRDRYDMLPQIAARMGLDTCSPRTMWQERALVELHVAVLHSFRAAGVTMVDHHKAAEEFVRFVELERADGREVLANRAWISPPVSPARCPTWSLDYRDEHVKPNYFLQRPAWEAAQGSAQDRS